LLPLLEFELAGQLVHVDAVTAPVAVEYLPLMQLIQDVTAVRSEYLPAPHAMQIADDKVAYFPIGQAAHTVTLTLA